eukprot:3683126-Heterocapsa_arctica.AAC.1
MTKLTRAVPGEARQRRKRAHDSRRLLEGRTKGTHVGHLRGSALEPDLLREGLPREQPGSRRVLK